MRTLPFAALLVAGCSGADPVPLQWNLKKGETVRYENKVELYGKYGKYSARILDRVVESRIEVQEAGLRATWVRLRGREYDPAAKEETIDYEFDTKEGHPPKLPWAAAFRELEGQSATFRVSPEGKVLEVQGAERIRAALPPIPHEMIGAMPDWPIRVGEAWESAGRCPEIGPVPSAPWKIHSVLRALEEEGRLAHVEQTYDLGAAGSGRGRFVWLVREGRVHEYSWEFTTAVSAPKMPGTCEVRGSTLLTAR
jgi:hypothetical protein